jgi:hypothetical protein
MTTGAETKEGVKTFRAQDIIVFLHGMGFEILKIVHPEWYYTSGPDTHCALSIFAHREKDDLFVSILVNAPPMFRALTDNKVPKNFDSFELGVAKPAGEDMKIFGISAEFFREEFRKAIDDEPEE